MLPSTLCRSTYPIFRNNVSKIRTLTRCPRSYSDLFTTPFQHSPDNNGGIGLGIRNLSLCAKVRGLTVAGGSVNLAETRTIHNIGVGQLSTIFSRILISSPLSVPSMSFPLKTPARTVTKCSIRKGRRKTVGVVKNRFFRLDWGGWISTQPGRFRHLWKKSMKKRNQLRHHVFRDEKECELLDKMTTKYWVKKKYFVDDPYESYHTRDNFHLTRGLQGINTIKMYNSRVPRIKYKGKQQREQKLKARLLK